MIAILLCRVLPVAFSSSMPFAKDTERNYPHTPDFSMTPHHFSLVGSLHEGTAMWIHTLENECHFSLQPTRSDVVASWVPHAEC